MPTYRDISEKDMYGAQYYLYRLGFDNVPAFEDEKNVRNISNYKTSIKAELNAIYRDTGNMSSPIPYIAHHVDNGFESYALTWNDIQKRLYKDENFGDQLKKENLIKDLLPAEIKNIVSVTDKARAILKFVQKKYTWNQDYDVVTDKGVKNLINTGVGNSAEINLLLTMLMRSEKIDANPVVLSTVRNGVLMSYSPSIDLLNHVITGAKIGKDTYLYDAVSKFSDVNLLPAQDYNYNGYMMTQKEAVPLDIIFSDTSEQYFTVEAKLNADRTFSGNFSDYTTKMLAMIANQKYSKDAETYQKEEYKNKYKFPLSNITSSATEDGDFETTFDFSSDSFVDNINNKLVFNPLLFLFSKNHDFDQTEPRKSPSPAQRTTRCRPAAADCQGRH
jgi:hypothetical protein